MISRTRYLFLLLAAVLLFSFTSTAASAKDITITIPKALEGLSISGLGYLDYSSGKLPEAGNSEKSYNEFSLKRGYITVKKKINPWLGTRATLDIHKGADGSYYERMKYLYAEIKPGSLGFLTDTKMEIGLGHIPWLDFEEHVNPYRSQGTMAIERAGVLNSADSGISIRGNFGGKLADAKEKTGNHHYDGLYGTWHIGIYNGPGYHGTEKNNNKVVEGRFTLRPLPDAVPGLQFSYFGLFGDGNEIKAAGAKDYPDYRVNLGMISYEHPNAIFTAQYITTDGQKDGKWYDASGDALKTAGYSLFGTVKIAMVDPKLAVFGRYDHFDQDKDSKIASNADYDMVIAGLSYDFYKGNMLVLDYETTDYGKDSAGKGKLPVAGTNLGDDHKFQAVWQVKF
ncbi:MAG: hypothetical protein GXP53_12175 [Deltaproteobacteria bacterium]|nr:hypothetical protein [Deltaproteobacteria bacterium]